MSPLGLLTALSCGIWLTCEGAPLSPLVYLLLRIEISLMSELLSLAPALVEESFVAFSWILCSGFLPFYLAIVGF